MVWYVSVSKDLKCIARVCNLHYLQDLIDGFLVHGQTGIGVFAKGLGKGTKRKKTLCVGLQQKQDKG